MGSDAVEAEWDRKGRPTGPQVLLGFVIIRDQVNGSTGNLEGHLGSFYGDRGHCSHSGSHDHGRTSLEQ